MKNYRLCKIYKGAKKGMRPTLNNWYVYYYFFDGVEWKRFRLKEDINTAKTITERTHRANALKEAMDELLMAGYNPFRDDNRIILKQFTMKEGIDWAMSRKKFAHKTQLDFNSIVKHFHETSAKLGYGSLELKKVTRIIIREIIEKMVESRNLGNHAYLKYKNNLGNLFEELVSWEKIDFNPCRFKTTIRKPKPKTKILLSEDQRMLIKNTLLEKNPNFFNYLMFINLTALRPVEILRLKVEDIDLKNSRIIIRSEITKDSEDRITIIPKALEPYIDIDAPKHYYLFGHDFKPQERKKPLSRDKATHLWQELIIKGLGIDSKMYWLKHLGLTSMRQQGIDPEIVQYHAGHSTYEMTQVYVSSDRPEVVKAIRERKGDF